MSKKSDLLPNYSQNHNCDCSCCKKYRLQYEQVRVSENALGAESLLNQLPKIKARAGFAQKMSALFALELEKETIQRNKSWLQKKKGVKLPGLRSDISKELF